jgi:ribosomal protein S18 acetylase RimI-like enzyme
MNNIEYSVTDAEELDIIEPLWNKLIVHHRERATHFRKMLGNIDFDKRKQQLLEKDNIRIDLAYNADKEQLIGYCVSTIDAKKQGEVESIYVEEDYRRNGIAGNLMKKALRWMDDMSAERKVLLVATGNEEVLPFYERYGFYPRGIVMELVENR